MAKTNALSSPPLNGLSGEVLFALRWQFLGPWAIEAGAGVGLTQGYGSPSVREFLSVAWAPIPAPVRTIATKSPG